MVCDQIHYPNNYLDSFPYTEHLDHYTLAQLAATQEQRRLDLLAHTKRIEAFTQQQADLEFLFRKVDNVSPEIAAMIEAHKRVILEWLNTCPGSMGMMTGSALGIGDGTGDSVEDGDPLCFL